MGDNKITVDVELTGNGQVQINQYTNAFDNLKDAVGGLSRPFSIFSNNINTLNNNLVKYNDALVKANKQNQELAKSGDDAGKKINELAETFTLWSDVSKIVKEAIAGVEGALSGLQAAATAGIAVIVTFLPEIWNFVKAQLKGKEAIDEAKMSLDSLNKGLASTQYAQAIENVDNLRIKVNLAKDGFALKSEVVKEYNETLGQTIGQVKTLDEVETSLKNNAKDYIKMMLNKASAMAAIKEAADNELQAQKELHKSDEDSVDYMHSGLKDSKDPEAKKLYKDIARRNREEAAKLFQDKSQGLLKLAEKFEKDAAVFENKNPVFILKQQLEKLQSTADASKLGSDTFKKIQDLKKQLSLLEEEASSNIAHINVIEGKEKDKKNKPKSPAPHPAKDLLAAQSITFAKTIELDKQNYDKELALLNDQLAKKLISQQQYDEQSQALQEQYHLAVGERINTFNQNDLQKAQQHMQDMVEAQRLQDYVIPQDEKDVKKAILPGQKLDAEKQLITDKYNYEIAMADGNSQKIKELTAQREEAITQLTQQYEQQRTEFALQSAQKVSDAAFSILKNNIKAGADAKVKDLESQKDAELSNKNLTANQRKSIEDKYKKKEAEEKTKAFKAEQRASILQAVINGALAITKATAQSGMLAPFVIPGIIAETAIQVATIAAQKAPQYAKGGLHFKSDGRGAVLSGYSRADDTNAYLRSGEAVVVSEAMRNPWARNLVSAINVAYGGRDFSVSNPGRGYAIGGIFTDGGNANRYYSQPANDVKDLANTLAYQMINNFPPIYVDVKDVNNQQNILAQTVNRVNL